MKLAAPIALVALVLALTAVVVRLARVERSPLRTGSSDAPAEPRASSDAERSATELVAAEPPEEPARGAQDDAQDPAPNMRSLFTDYVHPSSQGITLLAQEFFKAITQRQPVS
jgi:hypothetical protein